MSIEGFLRGTAVAVAILATVDPPVTLRARARPRLGVVVQDGVSMNLPAADSGTTRRATAARVVADLKSDLEGEFEIVNGRIDDAAAIVVVGDRYPDEEFPEGARVSTVTVSSPLRPNVRIAEVSAPARVPPETAVRLGVTVEASGMASARSDVVVRAGGADVGRASHEWTEDLETWTADVVAVPLGVSPLTFDVRVVSSSTERTDLDNHALIAIDQAARLRVFVLEARPSWTAAFVRRALERDPRFDVVGLIQASPRIAVTSGDSSSLTTERIDRFDTFDVVIAGGLDRLSANQQTALEHFAVERGGAVALLPDTRASAAAASRFLPAVEIAERLLDQPGGLTSASDSPRLEASELLEGAAIPRDSTVIARGSGSGRPVVWTSPVGEGRVLFAGAMDAWRFRGAVDGPFDRFWRSTIAGLALEAQPPIDVQLIPNRASPGQRVHVTARVRTRERNQLQDRLSIEARVGEEPIRLWPDAPRGSFSGTFVADPKFTGPSTLVVVRSGEAVSGQARLTIDPNMTDASAPPLALLARAHSGVNVVPSRLADLERHVRGVGILPSEQRAHYPMRSPWWFVPFAACLSGEWWLRRRTGRR